VAHHQITNTSPPLFDSLTPRTLLSLKVFLSDYLYTHFTHSRIWVPRLDSYCIGAYLTPVVTEADDVSSLLILVTHLSS